MSKTTVLFTILFMFSFSIFSQNLQKTSVEKSMYGVQSGLFGVFAYNESKLTDNIALRSEIGMLMGVFGGSSYSKVGYVFTPTFSVEPRYYYNLKRRIKKDKNIQHNSGNFISLKTNFNPDLFTISNHNGSISNHITTALSYGLRRTFAKHFDYEFTTGLGYLYDFDDKKGGAHFNIGFRVGYRF